MQQLYIDVETLWKGPQQTLRRYRVRPYLERRFWTRPGRTSAWWDNFVHEVIPEEWLENFRMSRRSLLNLSELLRPHIGQRSGAEAAFQCGQWNSLKMINVDGEHFICFRSRSCILKFNRFSVDVAQMLKGIAACAQLCFHCTCPSILHCFGSFDTAYPDDITSLILIKVISMEHPWVPKSFRSINSNWTKKLLQ